MIIGRATKTSGKETLILGLSYINVINLIQGKPISRDLREAGIEADLMIIVGKSEDSLMDVLKTALGEPASVTDHRETEEKGDHEQ